MMQRLILLKENFYYLQLLTGRGLPCPRGMPCPMEPQGKHQVFSGDRCKIQGKYLLRFPWERKAGRGSGLRLANLNAVGGLWVIWVGSLVARVIWGGRNIGLVCQLKEVVGDVLVVQWLKKPACPC